MLPKEIKEDITEWKLTSCSKTVRFNIMKMQSISNSKNTLKKKLEDSLFLISKSTTKLQYLKQCSTDKKDRHIGQQNRELRNQTSCI